MQTYRFITAYKSGIGTWAEGDTAELDDDTAAWLLRDVAGCIEPVEAEAPANPEADEVTEERALDAPQHDRQLKRAPRKR